ncbi:MAG TPA: flagellar biosynthesis protein FlhA [Opitutaceae bacterium]|jgi:flagellar biosynthesis protein FlhA|nr:MAG: Flagellar biosynthesis protein FlhA [Verrucomicrobia bacterium ADurb.Bin122]HOD46031.1 flagellar biosynthesis protein FlhA [Opitutaceae bacterium]HOF08463.1 flagellar biosynthesis protein FlhA [Opitutaceae bacterium]HOR23768.1 flagellar biosynthesis protein FlhA [Opitutaceae bacterium]HOY53292.1 flagellar biosynthesis protein FlhA [Opitutaceae bacterium]
MAAAAKAPATPVAIPTAPGMTTQSLLSRADLLFAGALFATVLLLIVPVPPILLDGLLAISIGISLLVLLTIVYVKDPPEFSAFPTILLAFTLFRLSLNICSTRLILTKGHAGDIIDSFGNFVIQGNYIVGFVIFLILVVVNFVVITKGAGRIAEVSARFTLDALPGKQMAIDAELNAGLIDEATARARRVKVQKEADFYGAMDGASKFVRGDAIAGILITLVNVLGGFAIGVFQMDMSLGEALQKFTLLSIGDGLVSQIPSLIVSLAAGILVTRASENSNLGTQVGGQILRYPRAIGIGAGMMLVFGLMPGMPLLPFLALAGAAGYVARALKRQEAEAVARAEAEAANPKTKAGAAAPGGKEGASPASGPRALTDEFKKLIDLDVFAIEIGHGLLNLADAKAGGDLLSRITGVRKALAREKGILVPPVSVRDNLELEANEYRFLLRSKTIARGTVIAGRWMAMNVSGSSVKLRGVPTREPVFNLEAVWIDDTEKKAAELNGYTVVDPSSVLITHLSETLKSVAHLLLGRQDVQTLIDHVKDTHPALVSELLPDLVNLGIIQRVLQNLLRENISILNLPLILEGIGDFAPLSKNPDDLSELIRRRLGLYFVTELEYQPGKLRAVTLDPRFEQFLGTKIHRSASEVGLALDPATTHHLLNEINTRTAEQVQMGLPAVVVVGAEVRLAFKRFIEPTLPRLVVLAFQELPASTEVENLGLITVPAHLLRQPAELKAA